MNNSVRAKMAEGRELIWFVDEVAVERYAVKISARPRRSRWRIVLMVLVQVELGLDFESGC